MEKGDGGGGGGEELKNGELDRRQALAALTVAQLQAEARERQVPFKAKTRKDDPGGIELYDLGVDPAEANDVAGDHPEVVAEAERLFREARLTNPTFPQPLYDA